MVFPRKIVCRGVKPRKFCADEGLTAFDPSLGGFVFTEVRIYLTLTDG